MLNTKSVQCIGLPNRHAKRTVDAVDCLGLPNRLVTVTREL